MSVPPPLQARGLSKRFPGVLALAGVDLSLEPGSVHALCGENGAGKSTLLKILAGCHPHGSYEGELFRDGKPLRLRSPADADEAGIALVAQELALVPELSLFENVFLGRELGRGLLRKAEMRERCARALRRVGLDESPDLPVGSLSVGRQQLVEIAKALDKEARVLVLDEPTAALTAADAERLLALVRSLKEQGVACLYVSHRLEEVFAIADAITVLRDGKTVGEGPVASWTREKVVAAMVGRALQEDSAHAPEPMRTGAPALEVEHWSLEHPALPGRFAVEDIGFEVHPGEILGIAGLMGSGRTALLTSLFGAGKSRVTGRLRMKGGPWRGPFRHPREAMAQGLALVSEDRKGQGLVLSADLYENIALATLPSYLRRGGFLDWQALRRHAEARAAGLRVKAPSLSVEASSLSGGNQQKVVLAKWLETRPSVLLLDEPTRGIDVGAKAEIHALIRSLAADGLSVVVASSDLPELLAISHRLLVLNAGRQAAGLERGEFSQVAVMQAATGTAA